MVTVTLSREIRSLSPYLDGEGGCVFDVGEDNA